MANEIKIAFDAEDIGDKSDSEKLSLLLKIAFANHQTLIDHGKLLFGNGKQGICDSVRTAQQAIKALWVLAFFIIGGFITLALSH